MGDCCPRSPAKKPYVRDLRMRFLHSRGHGVSTVIILSVSHISAHTWPEHRYMHVDIVTCIRALDEVTLRRAFADVFGFERISALQLDYTG